MNLASSSVNAAACLTDILDKRRWQHQRWHRGVWSAKFMRVFQALLIVYRVRMDGFWCQNCHLLQSERWVNPQANSSDADEADAEEDAHSGPRL